MDFQSRGLPLTSSSSSAITLTVEGKPSISVVDAAAVRNDCEIWRPLGDINGDSGKPLVNEFGWSEFQPMDGDGWPRNGALWLACRSSTSPLHVMVGTCRLPPPAGCGTVFLFHINMTSYGVWMYATAALSRAQGKGGAGSLA